VANISDPVAHISDSSFALRAAVAAAAAAAAVAAAAAAVGHFDDHLA